MYKNLFMKYVKVKLIQKWSDHEVGEVFKLDEDTANNWVLMGRGEIVHPNTKITDQSEKTANKPPNPNAGTE